MAAGAEYIFNLFDEGRDVCFYMCSDKINAMSVARVTRDNDYDALLGCQDRYVRVVQVRILKAMLHRPFKLM